MQKYYTKSEIAEILGVSTRTVNRLVERGHLRAVRIGPQTVRFSEEDFRRMIDSMTDDRNQEANHG